MADVASTPGPSQDNVTSESPAELNVQKHEAHNPTVEEVQDEEDLVKRHDTPISNSVLEADDDPEPLVAPKPVKKVPIPLDTSSRELFPELNGAKKSPVTAAPEWGSNMRAPSPAPSASGSPSGASTPRSGGAPGSRPFVIPGRHSATMTIDPQYIQGKLKKPIADYMKDAYKKTNAKVTYRVQGDGKLIFTAIGPSESACNKALQQVSDSIGAEVSIRDPILCIHFHQLTTDSNSLSFRFLPA